MTIKDLQNMIYNSGKNGIIKDSFAFATNFNSIIQKAFDKFNNNDIESFRNILVKYFIYINVSKVLDDNFASFKVNDELNKNIEDALKDIEKITQLSETQILIISLFKSFPYITKKEDFDTALDEEAYMDISNVNSDQFIQSFNNILANRDISSMLNFIQINGLVESYKSFLRAGKEPILLFKFIYDCINDNDIQNILKGVSYDQVFLELAKSIDDEALKQNCQFLDNNKIEFPVKDNSTIVLSKFKQYNINLKIGDKNMETVNDLFTAIIKDENLIIRLEGDKISEIKEKLLDGIKYATKTLNAVLGFPDIIKGNNHTAEEILNITIQKEIINQQFNKTLIELIEIFFKSDSIDLYKSTKIYDSLYEGIYDDFVEVFDEVIKPSIDTGYKMTENIDLFWNSAINLQYGLENNQKIKECFQKFGQNVFHCDDYMITIKMLFTFFYSVGKYAPYTGVLYVCTIMTDNIFGNTWNAISKGIKNGLKNLF